MSETGLGTGELSPEALRRLDEPSVSVPVPIPVDLRDPAVVGAWRRKVHDRWGEGTERGEPSHEPSEIGGVGCLVAGPVDRPALLYVHGGGFCLGSAGVAAPITARLAVGLRVYSIDYRLAPEHPYPDALDDSTAALTALIAAHGSVAVAGDSAGGGLAVSAALRVGAGVSSLALFSPLLEVRKGRDVLLDAYLGARDEVMIDDDLSDLAPTLVQVGGAEQELGRQAARFVRRARLAGAVAHLDIWDGLWHTWHYHRELPEADHALAEAVAFVLANDPSASSAMLAPTRTPIATGVALRGGER